MRSLLSWRGWSSASAVFCKARSRHSAAVSMAFLGGPRRGASKQKAPNASVQNRTPRKTRNKSPAEAGLETGMKVSGKRAFLPSHQLTEAVSVPTRRSLDRCDGARRSRLPLDVGTRPTGHRCQRTVSNRLKKSPAEAGQDLPRTQLFGLTRCDVENQVSQKGQRGASMPRLLKPFWCLTEQHPATFRIIG